MTWNPYRVRPAGDGFRVTYSWWVSVPDGHGCIDWDEETEDADDLTRTLNDAHAHAARLNEDWHKADAERRARQRAAPLP